MSVSGISGASFLAASLTRQNLPGSSFALPTTQPSNGGASSSSSSGNDAVTQFMDYMKETPAQRMQDAWLQQHGISPQAFAAMTGAQKQKIIDERKQDIEAKLKQKMESGTSSNAKPTIDLSV